MLQPTEPPGQGYGVLLFNPLSLYEMIILEKKEESLHFTILNLLFKIQTALSPSGFLN